MHLTPQSAAASAVGCTDLLELLCCVIETVNEIAEIINAKQKNTPNMIGSVLTDSTKKYYANNARATNIYRNVIIYSLFVYLARYFITYGIKSAGIAQKNL